MRKGWPCQEARDLSEVMGLYMAGTRDIIQRCIYYSLWGCELLFLTINVVSFCPWSLSSPTTPRESPDTSCLWRALSSGPQRNNCLSFLLPQRESLLMILSLVWIKKSPGWGDVLVPALFRSSGVMQRERRCRQFGSCTRNKLECLFKHRWWKRLRFWGAKWCSVVRFYSIESKMWVLREAKEHISQNCRGQMCSLCGKYSDGHTSSVRLSWDGWSHLKPESESSSVHREFVCL